MSKTIDLNADMGEGFGAWSMGDDDALLQIVSSANIACGFHAGDPDVMARTMRSALARSVGLGAHPGFDDLQGFGRRPMALSAETLGNLVSYQVGAAQALAQAAGGSLNHVKLHGALYTMAARDKAMAKVCFQAALSAAPGVTMMVLAGSQQLAVAAEMGCDVAVELFADRAYNDDLSLVDRGEPGAVIHDPQDAARRTVAMLQAGAVITRSGQSVPTRIDTVCLHGDTPGAVGIARAVRTAIEEAGLAVSRLEGRPV